MEWSAAHKRWGADTKSVWNEGRDDSSFTDQSPPERGTDQLLEPKWLRTGGPILKLFRKESGRNLGREADFLPGGTAFVALRDPGRDRFVSLG